MKTIMFRHRYRIPALWLALALLPLPALAADACPQADAAALAAREAGQRWRQIFDGRAEDSLYDLSAPEREAIGAYKRALAEAIDARLACSGEKIDPAALRRTLAAALNVAAQPAPPKDKAASPDQLLIEVERSAVPHPLILVRAGFAIPCGDDNLLAGYAWNSGHWQRVLHWHSGDYQEVSGAYGDGFSFAALPGGQVVVAYGTPWCTSNWSHFRAAVIAPANGTAGQRVLFQMDADYFRDENIRLKKRPDGFELRAPVLSHDPGVLFRPGIFRYRVHGETVQRVQPAAANGRGFVDEWLGLDDVLARAWSDPAAADAVLQARQGLRKQDEATEALFSYGPVRACAGGENRYQVEIELRDTTASKQWQDWPSYYWYALIRQEQNGFTMLGLSATPDAACKGPDLMAKPTKAETQAKAPASASQTARQPKPGKGRQPSSTR